MSEYKLQTYYQKEFPLLSFTYALYCDGEFRRREVAEWRENHEYRGYLDTYHYTAGGHAAASASGGHNPRAAGRGFPAVTEDIIVNEVAAHGRRDSESRYLPTREQAWVSALDLLSEIADREYLVSGTKYAEHKSNSKEKPQPAPAVPIADRPLISCLAVIFLDPERSFRAGDLDAFFDQFDLNPSDEKILRTFGRSEDKFLKLGQALTLAPSLVEELLKPPGCW